MRVIVSKFFLVGFVCAFLFSCTNNTMARKAPVDPPLRSLTADEISVYNLALSHFFDSLLLSHGFSGGILVAKNNQVLYENYQGYADGHNTDSITAITPFHVASTSKTFTSTAIMQLVEQGKINLDDSLGTYFPSFPYEGITVRNLLTHSSGIPYYVNFFAKYKWDPKKYATNQDILSMLYANKPPLEFRTGSRFRYCNTNFALLALIVEKVTGRFFPDYVQDSIFNKCGMSNSYIVSQNNPGGFLDSWSGRRIYTFDTFDGIYGDKNVFTTCRDLMKYDSCIRNNVLLNASSYEQAWTPYYPDGHRTDPAEYYGLGWRLKVFSDSLKVPYHNGWWHGNNSVFQHLAADTAVIIVTGNHFMTRIYQAAKAANIFRPYYNIKDMAAEDQTEVNPAPVPAARTASAKKKRPVAKPAAKKRKR